MFTSVPLIPHIQLFSRKTAAKFWVKAAADEAAPRRSCIAAASSAHIVNSCCEFWCDLEVLKITHLVTPDEQFWFCSGLTSWIMPMNSEKAQLSWFRTLLRKEAAMSLSILSSSAMCLCSSDDGHGSGPEPGEETQSETRFGFDCCRTDEKLHSSILTLDLLRSNNL
ncbi:hypothetical protein XENOCAPTIV_017537 [Xenoophorus captivus]|uniref:Uncharacterized protein n=1 Tax=Xenoophorus captivus TaxID=1517983 RepID=A0ABV0SGN0_9TELE